MVLGGFAVINGDMNFADTLYWLQIVTTTVSNHSSHNSPFLTLLNSFFFSPPLVLTSPLSNTDRPDLKLSMFLSLSPHYRK